MEKKQVPVMFHPEILEKLDNERKRQLCTRSHLIEQAVKQYLKIDGASETHS